MFLEKCYLLCICLCTCVYICIYIHISFASLIIFLTCLSDKLIPFQAIEKEVKLFSNKRKEIKREIKELAKTVSVVISYANTFDPPSKITFWNLFCSIQHEKLYLFSFLPVCSKLSFLEFFNRVEILPYCTIYKQWFSSLCLFQILYLIF